MWCMYPRKVDCAVYEDAIAQVPLFGDLSRRELQILSASCREREYPAGASLLRQGETGVGLFILTAGTVRVTQLAPDGNVRELATLGQGEVFGEMSLLDDQPRTATVNALEPTRALVIPVWDFRAALREAPDIAIKLLAVMSRRIRKLESRESAAQ